MDPGTPVLINILNQLTSGVELLYSPDSGGNSPVYTFDNNITSGGRDSEYRNPTPISYHEKNKNDAGITTAKYPIGDFGLSGETAEIISQAETIEFDIPGDHMDDVEYKTTYTEIKIEKAQQFAVLFNVLIQIN